MKKVIIILLLVVAIAGGALYYLLGNNKSIKNDAPVVTVTKGDLLVTVVEGGSVQAVEEVLITSQVSSTVQIIKMVPEASEVKKGDLIIELDSASIQDKVDSKQLSYESALNKVTQAKESLEITLMQNKSLKKDAELELQAKNLELDKYKNGTWPLQKKQQNIQITITKAELATAKDRLEWTRQLHKKGYATRAELETDELNVKRKSLNIEEQIEKLRIMKEYEYKQQINQLDSAVQKAEQNKINVERKALSEKVKQESFVDEATKSFAIAKKSLEEAKEQLKFTKIKAPSDGMVSYVRGERGGSMIKEGETVRERQSLLKISNIAKMRVTLKVHESRVSQLKLNQIAYVTLDSLPNKRFKGRVRRIARAPDRQSWMSPDLKVYSTDVYLDEPLPEGYNYPGLSARAEIIINKMENVVSVPIQAVASHENKLVVLVMDDNGESDLKEVTVGAYNDTNVEIISGLEEGDNVSLAPPNLAEAESLGLSIINSDDVDKKEIAKAELEGSSMQNSQVDKSVMGKLKEKRQRGNSKPVSKGSKIRKKSAR